MSLNLDTIIDQESPEQDYNDIPVEYCTKCLSLRIINYQGRVKSYCEECGNVETATTHIDNWEEMYKKRYGIAFIPERNSLIN